MVDRRHPGGLFADQWRALFDQPGSRHDGARRPPGFLADWRETYRRRRDLALEGLSGIAGLETATPEGAFYIWPNCGGLIGANRPGGRAIETSTDLASYFLDAGVVVVPGAGFHSEPYFRMSVATSQDNIREGIRRMEAAREALS